MKKLHFGLLTVLTALSVFVLSGCGGGGSSTGPRIDPEPSIEVLQVITLNSPAIERNKRYKIYRGVTLSGMNGAKFYVANTGSEAVQSTMNLGFSELILTGDAFIVVNDSPEDASHSGGVVFAYDPSGVKNELLAGGNVSFTGGYRMKYRTLSLSDTGNMTYSTASSDRPYDADVYAAFTTERGTTTFAAGTGNYLSFIEPDGEYYLSRDIPLTGDVFRIVRKVNTFSGIISE